MKIILIRHGATPGNALKRYIGRTDEPLSEEGIRQAGCLRSALAAAFPELSAGPEDGMSGSGDCGGNKSVCAAGSVPFCPGIRPILAVSPMRRALQTAAILFGREAVKPAGGQKSPDADSAMNTDPDMVIVPDFRECDFGAFEGLNHQELADDPYYRRWVGSGASLPFPGGEAPEEFKERCCAAFLNLYRTVSVSGGPGGRVSGPDRPDRGEAADQTRTAGACREDKRILCITAHGGTVMSIAERFAVDGEGHARPFYDWYIGNAQAFVFETTGDTVNDHFLRRTGCIGF